MDHKDVIRKYYECFEKKLREPLEQILVKDFIHLSQYARYHDRDQMLDEIWPEVGKTKAADLNIYGKDGKYMVKYKVVGKREMKMAEYIEFQGEKISKIEVYTGFPPE